jgi:hypothetical protein
LGEAYVSRKSKRRSAIRKRSGWKIPFAGISKFIPKIKRVGASRLLKCFRRARRFDPLIVYWREMAAWCGFIAKQNAQSTEARGSHVCQVESLLEELTRLRDELSDISAKDRRIAKGRKR